MKQTPRSASQRTPASRIGPARAGRVPPRGEVVTRDPRWVTLLARDPAATFFYSVESTGVYCRPTCAARRPRPENVRFHESPRAAEIAGFRACLRCRPQQPAAVAKHAARIAAACRAIETAETPPRLETLARRAALSPFHFLRVFREVTGLTPRQYAAAHRAQRLREALRPGATSVIDAGFAAGFGSAAGLHAAADGALGMTPGNFRRGGAGMNIDYAFGNSSLGSILVAHTERGICALMLSDDRDELTRDLQHRFPKATLREADAGFRRRVTDVVRAVEHPETAGQLPLDLRGTAFQLRVWQALREIPAGSTVTYGELARRIGAPKAVRAVARACGANHVSVAVPCHRVIGANGDLTGYRWGKERKRALLARESATARAPAGRARARQL